MTGDHSKYDQILFLKIGKYIGFCMCRRSYLMWSPAIVTIVKWWEKGLYVCKRPEEEAEEGVGKERNDGLATRTRYASGRSTNEARRG